MISKFMYLATRISFLCLLLFIFQFTLPTANAVRPPSSFEVEAAYPPPGGNFGLSGLAWDGNNLWSSNAVTGKIYKHNMDLTLSVQSEYNSPGGSPYGLAWDGQNLWSCDWKTNRIYKHKMDVMLSVDGDFDGHATYYLVGLAWDGQNLWSCDADLTGPNYKKIRKHNMDSTLSIAFEADGPPCAETRGFSFSDYEENLWSTNYMLDCPAIIRYNMDSSLSVANSYMVPGFVSGIDCGESEEHETLNCNGGWTGLAWVDNYLWICNFFLGESIYSGKAIYKLKPIEPACPHPIGHWDYCRDCGPCVESKGDCDSDSECQAGLICVDNVGADYGWHSVVDVCEAPTFDCPHPIGHNDYCQDCGPCIEGEGDCDSDSECENGLSCPQISGTDTCQFICPHPVGHNDYCRDCGPCAIGEGDCDNDSECNGSLICPQVSGTDICLCPHPVGHNDYCRDCGPCTAGEGDCDNDGECLGNLSCPQVTGTDTCQFVPPVCPHPVGHNDYCRDCGPCAAGEGDCDSDIECQGDLICPQVDGTDTCQDVPPVCPHPVGHNDFCRDCGPCDLGQGDCDNDGECAGDLTCPQVDGTDTCQ